MLFSLAIISLGKRGLVVLLMVLASLFVTCWFASLNYHIIKCSSLFHLDVIVAVFFLFFMPKSQFFSHVSPGIPRSIQY